MGTRAITAVRRKLSLLVDVEARMAGFIEADSKMRASLPKLLAGSLEAPEVLGGVLEFLEKFEHTGPGKPSEGNTSDLHLLSTFKLVPEHGMMARFKEIAADAGEWWAQTCLDQAAKGVGHAGLDACMNIAIGTGMDSDHPKLLRAKCILTERLAERVLSDAKEKRDICIERRQQAKEQNKLPPYGEATKAADHVEGLVKRAVAEKVPRKDVRLEKAMEVVKLLREMDGELKRLIEREKRLA